MMFLLAARLSAQRRLPALGRSRTRPQSRALGSSDTDGSTVETEADDPLRTILGASDALSAFTARLRDLSADINRTITLPSGQAVTLKDIVMHSRDSETDAFGRPAAVSARGAVLPLAERVEGEMRSLAEDYVGNVAPRMARAMRICYETPCGGASWELGRIGGDGAGGGSEGTGKLRTVRGADTPCGRLQASSGEFVKLTYETREDAALGSRAACLLRMAEEHRAPLAVVRQTREGREAMGRAFAREKVATPWMRTEEEYEEYFRIRDETNTDGEKH